MRLAGVIWILDVPFKQLRFASFDPMTNNADSANPNAPLQDSIAGAWRARALLHADADMADSLQNAYRVFHGFHDGLRGLNIDRLGDSCVVSLKEHLGQHIPAIREGLEACHRFERVILRTHPRHNYNPKPLRIEALVGDLPGTALQVRDKGMRFLVDLTADTNPGLFLDARPVRGWLLEHSAGRRVLNLFAFTGSLGVAAAVGGARSVTHVDWNRDSLEIARANHSLNDVAVEDRDLMKGDIYYHLPRAAKAHKSFDGIILDPPPQLPRSKRGRAQGQDYPKLTRLATPLLAQGGWLLCFFHRYECSREAYEAQVLAASCCDLEVLWRGTSGEDFPERDPEQKLRLTAFRRPQV